MSTSLRRGNFNYVTMIGLCIALIASLIVGRWLRSWSSSKVAQPIVMQKAAVVEPMSTALHKEGRGELLYLNYCAKCHGPDGHGDGDAAVKLQPPPRDFARRPWRFEPTAESIRRVTREGISGTAMPSAKQLLTGEDLEAVVRYVLLLAGDGSQGVVESPAEKLARSAGFQMFPQPGIAPNFTVVDATEKTISLQDFRGKVVVVYFWGTSCAHCLQALPQVVRLMNEFRSAGIVLLPICADSDDASEAQNLVDGVSPGTRVFVDHSGSLIHRYEVQALPKICIIDGSGRQIATGIGSKKWESAEMRDWLQQLVDSRIASPLKARE